MYTHWTFRTLIGVVVQGSVLAFIATPGVVAAQVVFTPGQGGGNGQQLNIDVQNMFGAALNEAMNRRATLTPALGVIDAKTHQATFTLENMGDDTLDVALSVHNTPPAELSKNDSSATSPLLADTTSKTTAADSTHSLVAWVTGLPKSVVLLPHGKQTLTVNTNVPAGTAPGEYSGWIAAESSARASAAKQGGIQFTINDESGNPRKPMAASKLVYKVQ